MHTTCLKIYVLDRRRFVIRRVRLFVNCNIAFSKSNLFNVSLALINLVKLCKEIGLILFLTPYTRIVLLIGSLTTNIYGGCKKYSAGKS